MSGARQIAGTGPSNTRTTSSLADLMPDAFPQVDWDEKGSATALEHIRQYVTKEANQAIEWYLRRRAWKRRGGQITRLTAMFAVALAGVLPVLGQLLGENGQFAVHPAWSTVLLGVVALLVSLDYFGGFTSGWIRYLEAEQSISRVIYEFNFDWEIMRLSWASGQPNSEQTRLALERQKETLLRILRVVVEETSAWASEFRNVIHRLDEETQPRDDVARSLPGAVVEVTNGTSVSEWTLTVDDGAQTTHRGTRAALTGLRPGSHKFVVEGLGGTQNMKDEVVAEVSTSGVTGVTMTLR